MLGHYYGQPAVGEDGGLFNLWMIMPFLAGW
jgi:hypothetical protein